MKKIKPSLIIYPLLILLSVVLIVVMTHNAQQSIFSLPMRVSFQGEYQTDSGSWQPISDDRKITFSGDEIRLRGYFQLEMPDRTVVGRVPKDMHLITYFDHIGGYININGELVHYFDQENRQYGIDSCGEGWTTFDCPADENDTMEIILINPHKYGNSDAVNKFLSSLYTYSGTAFDEQMLRTGNVQRMAGIVIVVVSFIMLGVAIFSTILNVPYSRMIWIFGLMILIAGGFCIIDSPNYSLYGNSDVFNTTIKHLCIMLYPLFVFSLAENSLDDKLKKAGGAVTVIYGILSIAAVIIALTGKMLIYDLNYYMLMIQLAAVLILTVLCVMSFKGDNAGQVFMTVVCTAALLALGVDIAAVLSGIWNTAVVSQAVFAVVFICALFYSMRIIPLNIKASIHVKELQFELQENKVAVMLSQIQPHFLYNALSAICDLCGSDPIMARDALVDFSVYLRENMDAIGCSESVSFERELSHIKTYMKLEKLRFGDKLNVVYDISAEDFYIQPLTIQPIVENAVKHGVSVKENGGTVTLKTAEENGMVTIIISDDGVGFDVNAVKNVGCTRSHVGLENVRSRVEQFRDGKFTVESEKGKGTVVSISFRK